MKIENTKIKDFIVSTCFIKYSLYPYETAISNKNIKNGEWIVIQQYDTNVQAIKGHIKIVEDIKNNILNENNVLEKEL